MDNRIIPLKRGFVGVINRGQKDIDEGVSIRQVREREHICSHWALFVPGSYVYTRSCLRDTYMVDTAA